MRKGIDTYVQGLKEEFDSRRLRPRFHFSSPAGWMNDPHAPVWFRGQYHLFFNYYPFEAEGVRPKCWGHAVTTDFTSYRLLPTAIAPDSEYDRDGCASGCAVVHEDRLYLIYTGRNYYRRPREAQCVAWSEDGIHFVKSSLNPVVLPEDQREADFRDPWVYRGGGEWRMLLGRREGKRPCVSWYRSEDLLHWEYGGIFARGLEGQGDMWECPSLWNCGDSSVLLASPEHIGGVRQKSLYFVGEEFEGEESEREESEGKESGESLIQHGIQEADYGCDFYAAQFFAGRNGETLVNAWMNKWENEHRTKREGWIGTMTSPRTFAMGEDGRIRGEFAEPLKALRENGRVYGRTVLSGRQMLFSNPGNVCFWMSFGLDWSQSDGSYLKIVLLAESQGEGGLALCFSRRDGLLTVENATVNHQEPTKEIPLEADFWTKELKMDILVDVSCVEVVVNSSMFITNCVYPQETKVCHYWECDGRTEVSYMELYDMREAKVEFCMTEETSAGITV